MNSHLIGAERNGYKMISIRTPGWSLKTDHMVLFPSVMMADVMSPMMMIRTSDIRQGWELESSDREPRKWRPSVSLIPHQSQSQAALSFIHEAEMSVLVLRFGREGLVVFKQMKYGFDIRSRIECLVWGLKTITYDHNNLYIWSCGHWKFTTSVPKVNLLRLRKLTWPWCYQSPC